MKNESGFSSLYILSFLSGLIEVDKYDMCLKWFCGSSDKVSFSTISVPSRAKTLKTPQLVITNVLFRQVLPHFICLPQGT